MGLDIHGTRFLMYAKALGVDYSHSAMIGRQGLHLKSSDLGDNFTKFGYSLSEKEVNDILTASDGYAEGFLKFLGAVESHSFDNSNYEGGTHIHDMNLGISNKLKGQYSMVLDGGALEHIFNFPVAIKNCMQMLHVGGHYLGISPANNFMGHGFYQLSPELYFSIFSKENGFEIVDIIAFEDNRDSSWFSVRNPAVVKSRVKLRNNTPTYLLIIAKKISECEVFEYTPQQSDYVAMWNKSEKIETGKTQIQLGKDRALIIQKKTFENIIRVLFMPLDLLIKKILRYRRLKVFSSKYFKVIDPAAIKTKK